MRAWVVRRMDLIGGAVVGLAGAGLVLLGNPRNSGICASCFAENVAGALRLHQDPRMSYLRPEFMGFLLGSTLAALAARGFQARGGSAPIVRFFVGMLLIVGSAVFLGCPIKVFLRLAGGDLTALPGVGGLAAGAWLGVLFLKKGFFLGKAARTRPLAGWVMPAIMALLAAASLLAPPAFTGGVVGAAAEHAPAVLSLGIGLVVGGIAQRSKFCVSGGLRNFFLTGSWGVLGGIGLLFLAPLLLNLATGQFHPGLYDQPGTIAKSLTSSQPRLKSPAGIIRVRPAGERRNCSVAIRVVLRRGEYVFVPRPRALSGCLARLSFEEPHQGLSRALYDPLWLLSLVQQERQFPAPDAAEAPSQGAIPARSTDRARLREFLPAWRQGPDDLRSYESSSRYRRSQHRRPESLLADFAR